MAYIYHNSAISCHATAPEAEQTTFFQFSRVRVIDLRIVMVNIYKVGGW